MIDSNAVDNRAVPVDELINQLTDYIMVPPPPSEEALKTAKLCLLDSIGCAQGAKTIGAGDRLDPVKAAFDNGILIRWLDFNDTWLAAEWGHPSDNLGGLLAVADFRCRNLGAFGLKQKVSVGQLLRLAIQAHEIQGVLALENSFNRIGIDHVLLVKVATAGLIAKLISDDAEAVTSALTHAWVDGHSLRTYRHSPNTSSRKSWAAGDATSRGVRLALMATQANIPALPSVLSAPRWGFADVLMGGELPKLGRELGCYVMENILFKVAYPAEFHAQTAVECAVRLHPDVRDRIDKIARIDLRTQESALRIISKTGELRNFADRDHCLQYMVAVALLEGDLRAEHYLDDYAANQKIDRLRELIVASEEPRYSVDYLDPNKRSIACAMRVGFDDGSATETIEIEYPLGHRRRREEAEPLLIDKFRTAALSRLGATKAEQLLAAFSDTKQLAAMGVDELVDLTS